MEHELTRVEGRIEDHIKKHDDDFSTLDKKIDSLKAWIIGLVITILLGGVSGFIGYGVLQEKTNDNHEEIARIRESFVTEKDLIAAVNLFDEKLKPIVDGVKTQSDDIKEIKRAFNIK